MTFREFLSLGSTWIIILPFVVGSILFAYLTFNSKLVLLLVILGLIPHVFFGVSSKFPGLPINFSFNLYAIIEFIIMFIICRSVIQSNFPYFTAVRRWTFLSSIVLYVFISTFLILRHGIRHVFVSELVFVNSFMFTAWILLYFYLILIDDRSEFTFQHSTTWYFISYLLFSATSALVFIFWNYKASGIIILKSFSYIKNLFNIVLYVFIAAGFFMDYKNSKKCMKIS